MDYELFNAIYEDPEFPKWNPDVASNISYSMMQDVEHYVIEAFRTSEAVYPEKLKFIGIEKVDPKTEYLEGGWNKKTHEVTINTAYLVRVLFEYDSEPLQPFFMYLPYCHKGGFMTIGGAKFALTPVLIDPCISITDKHIYVPLGKNKVIFEIMDYHYLENDKRVNKGIVYALVYRGSKKKPGQRGAATRNMVTTMSHYLFARYGVSGTFEKYLNIKSVAIGNEGFNEENYPPSEWVLCSSAGLKPDRLQVKTYYPTGVMLAIRREDYNEEAKALIAAFFYIADHFTKEFNDSDRELSSDLFFQRLLSRVILPFEEHGPTAFSYLKKHITSILSYIDEGLRQKLYMVERLHVKDIFDLFANIAFTYQERITITTQQLTSMYDKQLVLLPYLLRDIIYNINALSWDLQASRDDETFDKAKAERKIKNQLKGGISFILKINSSDHKESAAINNATDNLITKVSSPVVTQARMSASSNNRTRKPITPDMKLSMSIAEVGDLTSDAGCHTGRSRLNMFVHVGDRGFIERNPELRTIIDNAQQQISK